MKVPTVDAHETARCAVGFDVYGQRATERVHVRHCAVDVNWPGASWVELIDSTNFCSGGSFRSASAIGQYCAVMTGLVANWSATRLRSGADPLSIPQLQAVRDEGRSQGGQLILATRQRGAGRSPGRWLSPHARSGKCGDVARREVETLRDLNRRSATHVHDAAGDA
jgi:hypothetical protein